MPAPRNSQTRNADFQPGSSAVSVAFFFRRAPGSRSRNHQTATRARGRSRRPPPAGSNVCLRVPVRCPARVVEPFRSGRHLNVDGRARDKILRTPVLERGLRVRAPLAQLMPEDGMFGPGDAARGGCSPSKSGTDLGHAGVEERVETFIFGVEKGSGVFMAQWRRGGIRVSTASTRDRAPPSACPTEQVTSRRNAARTRDSRRTFRLGLRRGTFRGASPRLGRRGRPPTDGRASVQAGG